jgi:hypothetical protein
MVSDTNAPAVYITITIIIRVRVPIILSPLM